MFRLIGLVKKRWGAKMIEEVKPGLFVQKTVLGDYRVVRPIKKDVNKPFGWGNIHWQRFLIGSRSQILTVAIVVALICYMAAGYNKDISYCRDVMEHPQEFCLRNLVNQSAWGWDADFQLEPLNLSYEVSFLEKK